MNGSLFRTALAMLTVLPSRPANPRSPSQGRATLFFPIIGMSIGAVLLGISSLVATRVPQWTVAIVLVAAWEALSGGKTLWAWRQVGNWSEERTTSRTGGFLAMAALVLTKVAGLALQGNTRSAAVLFAPLLARWAMIVIATGARDACAPKRKFNPGIAFREFALTSVLSFAFVLSVGEAFGVLLTVCVAALTLGVRLLSHHWVGGVSWRLLQAAAQGIETFVVVLCTPLANLH
jgi:cobalamin synthase